MSQTNNPHAIHTTIWAEEAEPDNPFVTRVARCRGFDVYGEMLGQARWVELLWLLFREEPPSTAQADLLETLALALANPGPREASVHAAMCGGVGRSTAAASLMAALAVGAGQLGGGNELFMAMQAWAACGTDLSAWQRRLAQPPQPTSALWAEPAHVPGFDPQGRGTATPVRQTLARLCRYGVGPALPWLEAQRAALETTAGRPLAMPGVAAAAFTDLGFTPEQGEMLYLLLRLPGAAAHALEQRRHGYRKFPFGEIELNAGQEVQA